MHKYSRMRTAVLLILIYYMADNEPLEKAYQALVGPSRGTALITDM